MKRTILISAIVAMCMLLLPLFSLKGADNTSIQTAAPIKVEKPPAQTVSAKSYESFRILTGGEVREISAKDYIFGVCAGEMPAVYEKEALKAQAVAAYTFACFRKAARADAEYDLTDNPETDQCFITREVAAERWGEGAEDYSKKLDECIDEVLGIVLTYEGEIAQTVYHAISSGKTVSSEEVWGTALPYLVPVDSVGDTLAKGYLSTASFTADEIAAALSSIATASGEASEYFTDILYSDSNRVNSLKYCGVDCTGAQIAKLLSLRSSNFEIAFDGEGFTFTVKGYGHGVGMSQNGANYLAQQGADYKEILLHYYSGCELAK